MSTYTLPRIHINNNTFPAFIYSAKDLLEKMYVNFCFEFFFNNSISRFISTISFAHLEFKYEESRSFKQEESFKNEESDLNVKRVI